MHDIGKTGQFELMCDLSWMVYILKTLFINLCAEKSQYFSGKTKLFVLLTKYDLVEEQKIFKRQENDANILFSRKSYEDIEKDVIREANIVGTKEHNMLRWVSYVDGSEYDNPHIDNIALSFIKHMLSHQTGPAPVPPREIKVGWWTHLRLSAKRYFTEFQRRNIHFHVNACTLAIGVLCIGVLLGVLRLLMSTM